MFNWMFPTGGSGGSSSSSEDTSWLEDFDVDEDFFGDSWDSFLDLDTGPNTYGSDNYDFSWLDDDTFSADDFDMDSDWWDDTSWWEDSFDDEGTYNYDPMADMFNTDTSPEGQISDWMENYFSSGDSTSGIDYENMPWLIPGEDDKTGIFGGTWGPWLNETFTGGEGISGLLANIFGGGGGGGGNRSGGGILGNIFGGGGGGGGLLDSTLGKLLLAKYLTGKDEGPSGVVPIGTEAFGAGGGASLPDYRISNIQPALLPGMAYANQPTTFNADPPGMQAGGLASIPQGNKGLAKLPRNVRNNMGYMQAGGVASLENMMDGPGDITQAMLEPGEFVMTRKATENLTPEYLYKLMHQAENAGRMR